MADAGSRTAGPYAGGSARFGSVRLGQLKPCQAMRGLASGDASSDRAGQEAPGSSLLRQVPWDHKPAQSITLKMSFRSGPTQVSPSLRKHTEPLIQY